MTKHVLGAWRVDIEGRTGGLNRHNPTGYKVRSHEIAPGVVQGRERDGDRISRPSRGDGRLFSYRFDTPDRSIVISGDTAPTPALIEHSRGCDLLIHEAYSMMAYRNTERPTREFRHRHHTSSAQLAEIANEVKPGMLVTDHRSSVGEEGSSPGRDVLAEENPGAPTRVALSLRAIWIFSDRGSFYSTVMDKACQLARWTNRCPVRVQTEKNST